MTEPLTTPEIDTGGLDGFILDATRLLTSDLMDLSTGDEFKAAVRLWCKAWKQTPVGSLPSDDRTLASFAGVTAAQWQRIKAMALRSFVPCDDGRLYHPVLCADAIRAHQNRLARQDRTKAATDARRGSRYVPRGTVRNDQRNDNRNVGRNEVPVQYSTIAVHGDTRESAGARTPRPSEPTTQGTLACAAEQDPHPQDLIGEPTAPPLPRLPAAQWPYEQGSPWAQRLLRAGCKIGPQNWPRWQALVTRHGEDRVAEVAEAVDARNRWPDAVEAALGASRGQSPISAAVAKKTIRITT